MEVAVHGAIRKERVKRISKEMVDAGIHRREKFIQKEGSIFLGFIPNVNMLFFLFEHQGK